MPIPTRSVPGRDLRKQVQSANVGRTVTNLKPPSAATPPTEDVASKTVPSVLPTRRQSLVRPSQLRVPPSAKSGTISTSTRSVGRGPPSPVKQDDAARQRNGQPPSPKKTDMPPPPRSGRSASLRQPTSLSSGTPMASRGHARHRSQVITPASAHASRKLEPPQTPSTATTPRSRTLFTTYQQQFSPKKTVKPPTPTPSASTPLDQSSPLIPSSWPEIAALQTELLQLSLLHKSWWQQDVQWERDAEAQLRSKYNSVAGDYRATSAVAKESQRKLNGQALHCWLKNSREHNGQQGYAEQVQLLSQIAQEVYELSDKHGGRYIMAISEFENWLHRVEEIEESRAPQARGQDPGVFIDPIQHEWKEEVNALIMKLELASRQLQSLDILGYGEVEALDRSALFRTASGLNEMLGLMVEELSAMRRIEVDIVRSETMRVSQLAQKLTEMQARENPQEVIPRTGLWRRSSLKS